MAIYRPEQAQLTYGPEAAFGADSELARPALESSGWTAAINQAGGLPAGSLEIVYDTLATSTVTVGDFVAIGNVAAKQQYKSRQKFAKKEGLYKDFYKTTGNTLQPNSPLGKNYLKDAGFNKKTPTTPDRGGNNIIVETTKPIDPLLIKPKENFFNFKEYLNLRK